MNASTILIAGCGYVGSRLAEFLVADGHTVHGLKRRPETLPEGVRPVAADVTDPDTLGDMPTAVDALVYAVSPATRDEEAYRDAYLKGYRNVVEALTASAGTPVRMVLVSSTGVYGHTDGERVDEETPPEPTTPQGRVLVEAENTALASHPATVVLRLGGIYGPGRTRMIDRVREGESGCPPADQYSNRIHRDDAAGAARHLLSLSDPHSIYLGVDWEPAPLRDVYRWIADRIGAPDPCQTTETDPDEPVGRRGTNKRCLSTRLVESGYEFRYRTYREGYGAMLANSGPSTPGI